MRQKLLIIPIFLFLFSAFFIFPVKAAEKVHVYFFYGDGCPHCAKEEKLLNYLEGTRDNLIIHRYETWHNQGNAKLLKKVAEELGFNVRGVPFTIIGDETVSGYLNEETTGQKIISIIDDHTLNGCNDIVAPVINEKVNIEEQCVHGCAIGDDECIHECGCSADMVRQNDKMPETITIPLIGEVTTKNISLPLLTVLIAGADGFNPCAMWVLLFLINLLLNMQDRKRMWILGSAFIISSGLVYFLFLSAWLNFLLFIGFVLWLRILISLVALGSGGYHLYDFWQNRDGTCKVTNNEKRKLIFSNLRKVANAQKFWIALGGIIVLAAAVNLVELVCSAGLPAVYTQILTLSVLPAWQYYLYLILYIIIFMLDDMVVFFIAMKTLELKAADSKFTRYSNLVGGVIMLVLGILLLFKPGWIMF